MRNKLIKIAFSFAVFSLVGIFNTGTAEAGKFKTTAESDFSQVGTKCKVTKARGSSMYVDAVL